MKRVKIIFLTIALLFSMLIPTATYAEEVEPYEVAPCHLYGFHQMKLIGICSVRDEDTEERIFTGSLYKCDCGEYVVAEVPPTSTAYSEIGLFVRGYKLHSQILSGYYMLVPSSAVEYIDSMFVPGYRFYN